METGKHEVWWLRLARVLRHLSFDERHARRVMPSASASRVTERVRQSEQRHTGQIRVVVESGLPRSYLRRYLIGGTPLRTVVRERALMQFAKHRVWDTQDNNGLLIYLLVAERAIEVVADRGLARNRTDGDWRALVSGMREPFRLGEFESGVLLAIDRCSVWLEQEFPRAAGEMARSNELPDAPLLE